VERVEQAKDQQPGSEDKKESETVGATRDVGNGGAVNWMDHPGEGQQGGENLEAGLGGGGGCAVD